MGGVGAGVALGSPSANCGERRHKGSMGIVSMRLPLHVTKRMVTVNYPAGGFDASLPPIVVVPSHWR